MKGHIPERMCVVCRTMQPKKQLIRIVADGALHVDKSGKAQGRGAYVCKNATCVAGCKRTKAINKTLGMPVTDELMTELTEILNEQ